MGLDVGLTFGVRIDKDLITEEFVGCPNCEISIKSKHCAHCGSKKDAYKKIKYLCSEEEWDNLGFNESYEGCDGYLYLTEVDMLISDEDNPRAGDMMFFKEFPGEREKFIEKAIKDVKTAFGLDVVAEDFGYFVTMSY